MLEFVNIANDDSSEPELTNFRPNFGNVVVFKCIGHWICDIPPKLLSPLHYYHFTPVSSGYITTEQKI